MTDFTLEEYYNDLKEQINLSAGAHQAPQETQFLTFALDKLQELDEIQSYQLIDDARDANDRFRADAFIEEDDSELSTGMLGIVISLFDQAESPENLTKTELEKFLKKLKTFVTNTIKQDIDEIFEMGGGAHTLAKKIRKVVESERPKLKFYIISNKPLSSRITDLEEILINDIQIDTHIWDLNRFYEVYKGTGRVDIKIDLSQTPIGVLEASSNDKNINIYLGVIPGNTLFNIFDDWGSRLLEQNVRSFMGAKNDANKGMKETIRSAPEKFIAFNNGISATASEVVTENIAGRLFITKMTNFQIVNGGQTTATIYAAGKSKWDISKIYVQMKLVVVSEENVSDLLIKISEYSNTQSKVQKSDFFSHHDFHRRMHELSRQNIAPPEPNSVVRTKWYYERIRKQYQNEQTHMTDSQQKVFLRENPKQQLLTKTDLGKYVITFACLPHIVCKGGEYNFVQFSKIIREIWDKNEADINSHYFKETIAKAIIWKNLNSSLAERSMQMTSPSKIGTYAISLLMAKINSEGKKLNFEKIWDRQGVPEQLKNLLIEISKKVHSYATDDNREVENVDSYLKAERFWDLVKLSINDINLDPISNLFISENEVGEIIKDGRKDQRLTNALQIELKIKGVSPADWTLVEEYLDAHNLSTPAKLELIGIAKKSPHKMNPIQCKIIYETFYADYLIQNPNL
jgi:hypothetical protein